MKTVFIEAKYGQIVVLPDEFIKKLSKETKEIALFTTVQFKSMTQILQELPQLGSPYLISAPA
jgi:hypothetical protein